MTWISPRDRAGFRILAAFMEPSASPAPTRLWTSSITRMMLPQRLHLVDEALHPALKLAPELGPGHQSREIQEINLLIPELKGHLSLSNPLGQALGNGGLAHAGLANEAGVVLLAAVQDLDDPLRLRVPARPPGPAFPPGPGL